MSVYDTGAAPYQLYSEDKPQSGVNHFMIRSIHQSPDAINTRFFNSNNVDVIQNMLKSQIQSKTGFVIDRQDDDALLIIMRACYIENDVDSSLSPDDFVKGLNDMVVRIALPQIASGIKGYLAYLKDASSLPTPIPRAQNMSVKGTRTLELRSGL